jgi:hypothetical protein
LTKDDGQRDPTCWSVADGNDALATDTWNPIRSIYLLANEENVRFISKNKMISIYFVYSGLGKYSRSRFTIENAVRCDGYIALATIF